VDAGDVDAEGGDRSGSDRADDPLEVRRHGIEGPADPLVV
jgi:hypothetical protein